MIEVMENLFVGNADDYEKIVKNDPSFMVVQACKDPYHRRALGYKTRAAPKDNPEYLIARRKNRLILNLVDANDPTFISFDIIDAAIEFIGRNLADGKKVLVHCNLGESRAPSIALLYMAIVTDKWSSLADAESEFKKIYLNYHPSNGIFGFLGNNWNRYMGREE